jgi:HSP20 family protein
MRDRRPGPIIVASDARRVLMAIVKWSPWQELEALERRMGRLFEYPLPGPASIPNADVYETDTEWVAELEVPGFEEADLTVEVAGDMLRIAGRREEEKEEEKKDFRMRERLEASFERRFTLPAGVDADSISAIYGKGVLEIRAPKAAEAGPEAKTISIEAK